MNTITGSSAESDCIVTLAQTGLAPAAPLTVPDEGWRAPVWLATDLLIGLMLGAEFGVLAGLKAGHAVAGAVAGIAVGSLLALLVHVNALLARMNALLAHADARRVASRGARR